MNSAEPTANPLLAPLLALLRQASGSYKVHELLAELRRQEFIPPLPGDEQQLFRLNFLIMNALYQLQAELHDEGWWLLISTLDIRIEPLAPRNTASALARGEALRSYYLDWQVFWQTDREEVEALLGSFWRAYARDEHRAEALTLFALPAGAGPDAIRRRWRELALQHHPDRGGDADTFIRLRWAWEHLKTAK
ncbi:MULTISPECIES: DNA-J related domain-containing protein [Aeromonas]|uniref:DNA-J related domain-containing protein n=1 Tax=Aeromonas TaxID=642 RepID=UPI0005BE41D9|nr:MULTISPECIES: DNA-J related domain-containing protein [Aeromonas]ELM3752059.1 molecular chaperone [Aeromonas dhakensis]MBL0461875.1 molecular chaperone [Aeromonas dhakensis]MBL0603715.1 molecular chaperone [Aeromonas dhakensis]MBL0618737.1 molecular chaperone [Aeromonas dhakensis]MBL0659583.1 molecular chaperone [Aeromonas dhakensis]